MANRKPQLVEGTEELARSLNVSTRTAQRWVKAGCPREGGGRFDPHVVREWALDRRSRSARRGVHRNWVDQVDDLGTAGPTAERLRATDILLKRLKAKLAMIELKEKQGQTIDRNAIPELLAARHRMFQELLAGAQQRLAPRLVGLDSEREIQAILEQETEGVLAEAFGRPR